MCTDNAWKYKYRSCMEIYVQTLHGNICTDNANRYMYRQCKQIYVQTMRGNICTDYAWKIIFGTCIKKFNRETGRLARIPATFFFTFMHKENKKCSGKIGLFNVQFAYFCAKLRSYLQPKDTLAKICI